MSRGRWLVRWALVATVALAVLAFVRAALWRPLPLTGAAPDDGYVRLAGVVHVHTTASDGSGTPDEVVAAAQAAALDFLFITDHNTLAAKAVEGYHGRLLVGVGTEISTASGHLLALGIPDPAFRFWGDVDDALDDVRALGGAAFAAHPDSPRPDLRWTAWGHRGPWGIEVWNGDSQWRAAGFLRVLRTALLYPVEPGYALVGSLTTPRLEHWDRLLARRDVPAIAGADAHSRVALGRDRGDDGGSSREVARARGRALRFPSYGSLFRLARNHVLLEAPLTGDAARDLRAVVDALARGRSYVALDGLSPGVGFTFTAEGGPRRATMGETVALTPGLALHAGGRVPAGATVVLLRDGREIARARESLTHAVAAPGVYRVVVTVDGWPPWVVSNPIYVFDAEQAERRSAAAAWPSAAPAPAPMHILDGFEGATVFHTEVDPSSDVVEPLVVERDSGGGVEAAATGPTGKGLARLAFHLGLPAPGGPRHPWCALMSRAARDLTGSRGLVLTLKADGVYRFGVLVRDANPRGSDDGAETWLTSVRTSTEWRRVALPFARFRSLDPHSDGRLDLAQVRAVGLVIDDLAMKPGTRGTIWLDDWGTY